ncbi:MAG: NAD-dependent protein deacetylase [Proteobacteria bacterium]|jgi:NAD-dependent SIR2 family protein deacetylase|nr:NAD-dependent protein deacetylase [Pseudomonadota bacterium]MDA1301245.1 NAD-dependent protein deacetylase [Pseudomonadota bacterium]
MPELIDFLVRHRRLIVLTGAGCSVPSGIPTYRNHLGQWQRSNPITHQEFINNPVSRQRYWARSMAGWPMVAAAAPNRAHHALAELEARGHIALLVTQNVDGLHQKAGQQRVIDLHGRLDSVICLGCRLTLSRESVQAQLIDTNGKLPSAAAAAPDGDADLHMDIAGFNVPDCPRCGGVLKPDVVFFGGTVTRGIVATIYDALKDADALLVVGSSLMVYSGYRFCKKAKILDKPVACINPGRTRADDLFQLKVEQDCEASLSAVVDALKSRDQNISS